MPGNEKQSIEAELCKKLKISWADARNLTSYARGKLDIIPGDTKIDQRCRECIITTAIEADKHFPKKRNYLPKHTDNTREGHDPEQSVDKDDQGIQNCNCQPARNTMDRGDTGESTSSAIDGVKKNDDNMQCICCECLLAIGQFWNCSLSLVEKNVELLWQKEIRR